MKYLIALAVTAIALLWIVSGTEDQVNKMEQAQYCKMIKLYIETDGAYGWPDDGRDCSVDIGNDNW